MIPVNAILAAVMTFVDMLLPRIPALVSAGASVVGIIQGIESIIASSGATPGQQLDAANAAVKKLREGFDARLAELKEQAPNS